MLQIPLLRKITLAPYRKATETHREVTSPTLLANIVFKDAFCFEVESHCVSHAGFQPAILEPLPPKC